MNDTKLRLESVSEELGFNYFLYKNPFPVFIAHLFLFVCIFLKKFEYKSCIYQLFCIYKKMGFDHDLSYEYHFILV